MAESTADAQSERERYDTAWKKFRTSSIRYWLIFLTYLPGVLLFGGLLSHFLSDNLAHGIVAFAWLVAWIVGGRGYTHFRCPRCGNLFFARPGFYNYFASSCLHCSLHIYAYDSKVE